jgi:hypothetical protein
VKAPAPWKRSVTEVGILLQKPGWQILKRAGDRRCTLYRMWSTTRAMPVLTAVTLRAAVNYVHAFETELHAFETELAELKEVFETEKTRFPASDVRSRSLGRKKS